MQYEIPSRVSLVIGLNDTQMGFVRKAFIEAARLAGLPLLEQMDYADFILRLPINQIEREKLLDKRNQEKSTGFRLLWKGKDPTPRDGTIEIQDWEFNRQRGKWFGFSLNDVEKEELKRRQTYYVLNGGLLGSMQEIPRDTTKIVVDLNFVYEKSQFDQAKAQAAFQKQIAFAEKVYGVIEIRFFNTWTAGSGDWENENYKRREKRKLCQHIFIG